MNLKQTDMNTIKRPMGLLPAIFDELFVENKLDKANYETFSIPLVNISENFTTFVIELAVPGMEKESIDIEIDKRKLIVSSKHSSNEESAAKLEDTQFTKREFNYGDFKRSFTLPQSVNVNEIKANYANGVLSITLPKKEESKDIKRMVEIS